MITLTTSLLYRAFERLEETCKDAAELCNNAYWTTKEWHWHSKFPHNVRIGTVGLPNYYCPFCDDDLDYFIDFEGVKVGVCATCKKTWYATWENSDCPDFDNCNWPTIKNVLPTPPDPYWESALNHSFMKENGVWVDQGKPDMHIGGAS